MNKTLILMRHGEAGVAMRDIDRPLTDDGKKKCEAQGKRLRASDVVCSVMISSPAKRAWSSVVTVASVMGYPEDKIIVESKLYNAPADVLLRIVSRFDDTWNTVLLVAHNPGLSSLARELCAKIHSDLDVGEFSALVFPLLHWSDITTCKGQLVTYA